MNRIALCFALLTAFGSVAHAQGPAGSFGAGMESPLAVGPLFDGPTYLRMPGLSLRFQVSESFGIQAIAAVRTVTFVNDGDNVRATFGGGYFRAHIRLIEAENLQLGAFGGVGIGAVRGKQGDVDVSDRVLSFEGGLRPELFVADGRISLHFQLGISMAIAFADGAGFRRRGLRLRLRTQRGPLRQRGAHDLVRWLERLVVVGARVGTVERPAAERARAAARQRAAAGLGVGLVLSPRLRFDTSPLLRRRASSCVER
ncbi:MAG: hypothetical protein H6720_01430 [Sandaracinus sp.]|nr:hypothetical protein [Sandaracinus sp.]